MNSRAKGDGFIRIDVFTRLLAKDLGDNFLNLWHAALAADQNDLINLAGLETGVFDGGFTRAARSKDQILDQGFQLGPGQFEIKMLWAAGIGGHIRKIDIGLLA